VIDVYLVRHAIAEDRDPARWPDDSRRPLTEKGAASFRRAARGLQRIVPTVDRVLSSPYPRAWQTAEILRDEAGWPAPEPRDQLAAPSSPDAALELLRDQGANTSVALVGHEPNLSSFASLLLTGSEAPLRVELKKGGVIALDWATAPGPSAALLRWIASPKILRALDAGPGQS
jgi:phosphohistidine phosphatase